MWSSVRGKSSRATRMWAIDGGYHHRDSFTFPSHAYASSSAGLCRLGRHAAPSGPRFALMRNTSTARNAAASDASDAAVKMAFLSVFTTFTQWSRYCSRSARGRRTSLAETDRSDAVWKYAEIA
jgi:hypothetical protein